MLIDLIISIILIHLKPTGCLIFWSIVWMEIDKLINHIFTIIDTNDYSTVKKNFNSTTARTEWQGQEQL